MKFIAVALGGALGALFRYSLSSLNQHFPLGTFISNLVGCFFIGAIYFYIKEQSLPVTTHLFLITGCLGALTTFSSFQLELFTFFSNGEYRMFLLYFVASLGCGFVGVFLGKKCVEMFL